MPDWAKLRITNSNGAGRNTKLELDGVDISRYCQRVSFDADADDACRAELSILVSEVEIDGVAMLRFPQDGVRDLLVKHGWTPPSGLNEGK